MYSLTPSVYACLDQDAVVFLDLRRDKYLAVDADAAPQIVGVCAAGTGRAAPSLVERGLIQLSDGAFAPPKPSVSELEGELHPQAFRRERWSWVEYMRMVRACVRASIAVRSGRLDRAFCSFQRRKHGRVARNESIADAVACFELLRPWYPRRRVCLFDSLALMNFLLARGHRPVLVMGVRAKPFSAHCWLEADGVCLNDTAENCRAYAIMASA